ncbi:MAG: prolipoprotein diacylglyceryl transferase [Oscillospiraceae bacterium]|nr:prolipoprotein diacylglyceryl transferase [Oscillospiraceae bacterium]
MNTISFPKLGLEFNIDPIALHYGNGGIHWYGIIIAVGVVLALLLCSHIYKKHGRDPEQLLDFLIWVLPIGIVGARAYYVIFSWDAYRDDLAEIFRIWNGGLAVYGGILAGLVTALIFCRLKNINFLDFADVAVPGLAVGQCLGRWGNFVNGEAHGGATELLWGMSINGSAPVHPTFLYESLWSFAGILVLLFVLRQRTSGQTFFSYWLWYGIGRFFIEGLRTDSLYTASGLRASQVVAAVSVAVGLAGVILTEIKRHRQRRFEHCTQCEDNFS